MKTSIWKETRNFSCQINGVQHKVQFLWETCWRTVFDGCTWFITTGWSLFYLLYHHSYFPILFVIPRQRQIILFWVKFCKAGGNFPSSLSIHACSHYMVHTSPGLPWWLKPAVAPAAHRALMERSAVGFPQTQNVRYSHFVCTVSDVSCLSVTITLERRIKRTITPLPLWYLLNRAHSGQTQQQAGSFLQISPTNWLSWIPSGLDYGTGARKMHCLLPYSKLKELIINNAQKKPNNRFFSSQ